MTFVSETHPTTLTLQGVGFSADGNYMLLRNGSGHFELWDLTTRTLVSSGTAPKNTGEDPGIDSTGLVWTTRSSFGPLDSWRPGDTSVTGTYSLGFLGAGQIRIVNDEVFVTGTGMTAAHYLHSGAMVSVSVPFTVHSHIWDGSNIWVAGNSGSTIGFYCVRGPRTGTSHTMASPASLSSEMDACHVGSGKFICAQGTKWYTIDDTTWAASSVVDLGVDPTDQELFRVPQGATSTWINWTHVDLSGLTVIETINPVDWASTSLDRPTYDRVSNAIVADDAGDPLMWRFLGTVPDGGGDSGGSESTTTVRCWGFSLDDHDYYVLPGPGLVYDLKTNQWSEWVNEGITHLRAVVGQNWVGMTGTLANFATDIVAGDDTTGVLWIFDPTVGRDDLTETDADGNTDEAFSRIATSMVAANGRETIPCNAVQLTCSLGDPSQTDAAITLETSDDLGHSWTDHGSQTIVSGAFDAVIEWRGLGVIRAPGRIFRFTDNGGTVRLGRCEMR